MIYSSSDNLFTTSAVSWQPGPGCSVLAAGYEKHRNDNALMVWDLAQGRVSDKVRTNHSPVFKPSDQLQPVVEFGLTDSCCSLAWFRSGATVAAGMNGKVMWGKNILSRYKNICVCRWCGCTTRG